MNDELPAGLPRSIEVIGAAAALLICLPFLVLSIMLIAIESKGPVIFRQARVGRNGMLFTLYKLRTMRQDGCGISVTAAGDPRITTVGKILRESKLDEIPQFWNVLIGDMSLVGPRPEVPAYVDMRDSLWQIVLKAAPGITDPVAVRLRNEESVMAGISGDREAFYLRVLQPYKLRGYAAYIAVRSWRKDVQTLWDTVMSIAIPSRIDVVTLREILETCPRPVANYNDNPHPPA